MTSTQ
jgi:SpoVK/Ycf46/Vps4 family AAA+-type ATPase